MSTTATNASFPSGDPWDEVGHLTPQWRAFFLALFNRSGGSGIPTDITGLQKQVTAQNVAINTAVPIPPRPQYSPESSIAIPPASSAVPYLTPGNIFRSVGAKLKEAVSVLDFPGCDPTGVLDSTAAFQAAINSAKNPGIGLVYIPGGTYLISSTLNVTNSVDIVGYDKGAVTLQQNANFTMFNIAGFSGGFTLRGFTITNTLASASVTSGDAILVSSAFNGCIEDIIINNTWNGIHVRISQALYVSRIATFFHKNAGIVCDGGNNNDVTFRDCFLDGELAGVPHATFGIQLQDKNEGVNFDGCEVILCNQSIVTGATTYSAGNRPAYCRFVNCFFDSCPNGAQFDQCVDMTVNACWFTAFAGGTFACIVGSTNSDGVVFSTCTFINAPQYGCVVNAGAKRTTFKGCKVISNSTSAANTYSGLLIQANATDFVITGCTFTNGWGFAGTQKWGVLVVAGTSDRYIIQQNLVSGNATGGISDGGTGVNKAVSNNF